MWVGVGHAWGSVGGPTGVADAGFAGERVVDEEVGEIYQLADSPAAVKLAIRDRGDPGAVVAAVFKAFERLDKGWCSFVIAEDADDTTHEISLSTWPLLRRGVSGRGGGRGQIC